MSFGAEMKDFIAAFQVGSQIKDKRRALELDAEQEKNRSAEAANKAAAVESRYQRTQAFNQEGRDYTRGKDARTEAIAADKTTYDRGRDAKTDAATAGKAADESWYKQIEADPQLGYDAAGNVIPPPSQRGKPAEAIPTTSIPEAAGAIGPVSSSGMNDLMYTAIDGGLKHLSQEANTNGIESVMAGNGAPSPETVTAIDKIVDPDGKMSEEEITLARMEATYEFYTSRYKGKDGVERANAAAAQWLQHARGVAAIKAHAAQVLLQKGDHVGAAKQLADMHSSVPDGNTTTYDEQSNMFTITDNETGDVLQEGEATPELIDQIASSFTKGPEFFNIMKSAAMKDKNFNPGAGGKDAKPDKPVTSGDIKEQAPLEAEASREEIDASMFEMVSKEMVDVDGAPVFASPEEFLAQVGEDSAGALSDLAVMISGYNGIAPKEAAKLAMIIADPDINVGDPSEQQFDGFKVLPISAENKKAGKDVMVIQTPDGRELELPGNDATTAIRKANHGLFIAAKAITQKNVDMTNERVTNDNNAYNLQREEDLRLQEEQRNGQRFGRGNAVIPQAIPLQRSGRGG